eukprot:1141844-Pelagomonas_calceolata.AAC.5
MDGQGLGDARTSAHTHTHTHTHCSAIPHAGCGGQRYRSRSPECVPPARRLCCADRCCRRARAGHQHLCSWGTQVRASCGKFAARLQGTPRCPCEGEVREVAAGLQCMPGSCGGGCARHQQRKDKRSLGRPQAACMEASALVELLRNFLRNLDEKAVHTRPLGWGVF